LSRANEMQGRYAGKTAKNQHNSDKKLTPTNKKNRFAVGGWRARDGGEPKHYTYLKKMFTFVYGTRGSQSFKSWLCIRLVILQEG
jgi:hypothetical protein